MSTEHVNGRKPVRRFEFALSFDAHANGADTAAELPPPPVVEPSFTQADLDAAEARGFAMGRAEGETAALSRIEMRIADGLEQAAQSLRRAREIEAALTARVERDAAGLLLTSLRRLFPTLIEAGATIEAETLITRAFSQAIDRPRMLLRCPADIAAVLETKLRRAADEAGFEGRLAVIADVELGRGDCRIEWSDGGLERNANEMMKRIEDAIRRAVGNEETVT